MRDPEKSAMWFTIVMAAALIGYCSVTYAVPLLVRIWFTRRVLRAVIGRVVLTYDDGPGSVLQSELLELLRRHGARAIFFVTGEKAEAAPDLCMRLVEEGHAVCSHGFRHDNAWRRFPWQEWRDIRSGLDLVRSLCPGQPSIYRPPYGSITIWGLILLAIRRTRVLWWTHDSGDTWTDRPAPDRVVEEVLRDGGGVVLLHSMDRRLPESKEFVMEVTRELLEAGRDHGLSLQADGLWNVSRPAGR